VNTLKSSVVHRAQQYSFSLLDLIEYSQNPEEDLSTQVVEATQQMRFSTTCVNRPKWNMLL